MLKFTAQNIKHLPTTAAAGATLAPSSCSDPDPLIKLSQYFSFPPSVPPPLPPPLRLRLNGFNWLFRARHSGARDRSAPVKNGGGRAFANLHISPRCFQSSAGETAEQTPANVRGSALSGGAADGEFNHGGFLTVICLDAAAAAAAARC